MYTSYWLHEHIRDYQKDNFLDMTHDCETHFNLITHILYVLTQTDDHMSYNSPCNSFSQSQNLKFEERNN